MQEAIQEAKDVKTMQIEELQSTLETHGLMGNGKGNWYNNEKAKIDDKAESSKRGGGYGNNHLKKKDFDKSKVQCYNCEKYGDFADECWSKTGQKNDEEANIAQDNDPNTVLMMTTTP
ncbi:F-box protein [Trifolium medium]|uniref:F-box protein n=1 Tax=Trifolium medium TaxID=97028 RepID=A0A392MI15_9FABA|nr:F-box protein [Trifolium medium]